MELTKEDSPQGTKVYWKNGQVIGLLWNSHSKETGDYNATKAHFEVDEDAKTLTLTQVDFKLVGDRWVCFVGKSHVTDRMKRAVRKFIADEKGTSYWRVKL